MNIIYGFMELALIVIGMVGLGLIWIIIVALIWNGAR